MAATSRTLTTMADSVLLYGGPTRASDDILVALLLYEHELHQQISKATRNGINLFQYLPTINLSDLVLDALGLPTDGAGAGLLRGICRQYPIQMIRHGTQAEAQRTLNRMRRIVAEHNLGRSGKAP